MRRVHRARANRSKLAKHTFCLGLLVALLAIPLSGDRRTEALDGGGELSSDAKGGHSAGEGFASVPGLATPVLDVSALLGGRPALEGIPRVIRDRDRASRMSGDGDFITSFAETAPGEQPSGVSTGSGVGESFSGSAHGASSSSSSASASASAGATDAGPGVAFVVASAPESGRGPFAPGLTPAELGLTPVDAPSPTPEPGTLLLVGSGLAGLYALARRRGRG